MINITYIYLIENIDNDPYKVYIGKTRTPKIRETSHRRKFGTNIIYNVIDQIESTDKKIWKPIETMWIQTFKNWEFQVINKNKGGGGVNYHTTESRLKMMGSRSKECRDNISKALRGRIFTQEWINKIGQSKIGNKYHLGGKQTEETKNKIRLSKNKPIIQYDKEMNVICEWESIKKAALLLNIDNGHLYKTIVNPNRTAKGFIFKFK
jgi:hypothetical protein